MTTNNRALDMRATITPNSDQLNYEDFTAGPRTYTITKVTAGTREQPVFIHLDGANGRTYRPSKSMRRIIVAAWGADAKAYPGRSLTLYGDPNVTWAGKPVGGIRISHLSHISEQMHVPISTARGKRETFTVDPLPASQPQDNHTTDADQLLQQISETQTVDEITALAKHLKTINAPAAAIEAARKQWANLTHQNGENQ